jgi:hypothetical protein
MYKSPGSDGLSTKQLPPDILRRYASKKQDMGSSGKYLGAGTYIWGSDEFKKLYNAAMPFDKVRFRELAFKLLKHLLTIRCEMFHELIW